MALVALPRENGDDRVGDRPVMTIRPLSRAALKFFEDSRKLGGRLPRSLG
jgi:hypothetical protein